MEREPIQPNQGGQSELTAQGQNTYSRSEGKIMPDGNSPDINPTPDQAASQAPRVPIELSDSDKEQYKQVLNSPYSSAQQKTTARQILEAAGVNFGQTEKPKAEESSQASGSSKSTDSAEAEHARSARRSKGLDALGENATAREKLSAIVNERYGSNERITDETMAESTRADRDAIFNGIFLALDSQPAGFSQELMSPFTAPGAAYETFISSLARLANGPAGAKLAAENPTAFKEIQEDFERFKKESDARRILHDVISILHISGVKGETLFGYVEKFESSLVDMAFTTPGIREMTDFYEYAIRESMATHKFRGYLDPEKIRSRIESKTVLGEDGKPVVDENGNERGEVTVIPSEIDQRAMDLFKEFLDQGLLKSRTKDGREFSIKTLEPWEIKRIFNIAQGSMIASGRMISLAAESKLPPGPTRAASGFLQDIVQEYSALKHLNGKWTITAEGLAAYLYEGSTGNIQQDKILKRWDPHELKEMWERFEKDPDRMLYNLERVFYLGRMNPNRAGDVWTWMSWRAENKSDAVTMAQNFLLNGEKKQADRWAKFHPDQPSADEYKKFLDDPRFKHRFTDEDFFSMTAEERENAEPEKEKLDADRQAAWEKAHPGTMSIKEFRNFYQEYQNWSGTGFRFEKMRNDLAKAVDYTQHYHGSLEHQEHERKEAIKTGMELLHRIADLQGHRLYSKSEYIRKRLEDVMKARPELKNNLAQVLSDVQMAEASFLNAREELLDSGVTFDTAELDMGGTFDFFARGIKGEKPGKNADGEKTALSQEQRIKLAKEFVGIMKQDFATNSDKYKDEFITKREYTHGFVLWTGDVPIDEYNATAVGPTGAFVRRARDNKNQGLATGAETKLLDNLKNIHDVAQLEEVFEEIFASIDHYDRGKAQQAIAEKMLGILRFYKADSLTKIPFAGLLWKNMKPGDVSAARLFYGPEALALESSEINKLIRHFAHTKKITHGQERWLMDKLGATNKHLIYELGLDATELTSLAILLEFISMMGKEIAGGVQDAG